MHEQSETVQTPQGWQNIYGVNSGARAGQPLPLLFPWEHAYYPSAALASHAAAQRSQQVPSESAPYQGPLTQAQQLMIHAIQSRAGAH